MPSATSFEPLRILRVLGMHQVEFIVVGGVSAVLHGAPVTTFDLDVVHQRTPENIDRLLEALRELDASFRHQHGRRLVPEHVHLAAPGHQLLETNAGPLDVLGTIGQGLDYDALLPDSAEVRLEGMRLRVLRLSRHIEIKASLGTPKDLAVLPVLRRTLRERGEE